MPTRYMEGGEGGFTDEALEALALEALAALTLHHAEGHERVEHHLPRGKRASVLAFGWQQDPKNGLRGILATEEQGPCGSVRRGDKIWGIAAG